MAKKMSRVFGRNKAKLRDLRLGLYKKWDRHSPQYDNYVERKNQTINQKGVSPKFYDAGTPRDSS